MDWLKPIGTRKDKTPEERLYIAKIQTMMEDSFGLFAGIGGSMTLQQERNMMQTILLTLQNTY